MARRQGAVVAAVAVLAVITLVTVAPLATAGAGTEASTTTTSSANGTATDDPTGTTVPPMASTVVTVAPSDGPVPTAPGPTAPPRSAPESYLVESDDDVDSGPPGFLIAGLVLSLATAAVIGIALVLVQRRSSRTQP